MVVIVIMYVYSLRVGELGFPTLLLIWLLGTYNPYSDRVWAAELLPEAEYVRALSIISQQLAESFTKNTEPHPTLPTGGRGLAT
jgi:hypothetical protein